jgi:hypothetical protein
MKFISTAFLSAAVLAHFDIEYPTPRAQTDDFEVPPCGNSAPAPRQKFPIVGGVIKLLGYHKESLVTFRLSLKEQPTTMQDFDLELRPNMYRERSGPFESGPIDLSKIPGVRNGVVGTIQIFTKDSHDFAYQCADVIFEGADSPSAPPTNNQPANPSAPPTNNQPANPSTPPTNNQPANPSAPPTNNQPANPSTPPTNKQPAASGVTVTSSINALPTSESYRPANTENVVSSAGGVFASLSLLILSALV